MILDKKVGKGLEKRFLALESDDNHAHVGPVGRIVKPGTPSGHAGFQPRGK
jgi:hypothetical protein